MESRPLEAESLSVDVRMDRHVEVNSGFSEYLNATETDVRWYEWDIIEQLFFINTFVVA
jgi:hypothetical protein